MYVCMYVCEYNLQWRLRFKITVCHTEESYLKHVTLLNRFKIVFLLNRDIGLRETYLKPNIWVLESPGLGSRALKGQAVAVAPNRSVESAFRNIYAILPCVGGPTRSTILPCCVLAEYILLRIYCRINCSLSQGYSNITTPCSSQQNTERGEAAWASLTVLCTYYCISDAKKRKQKTTKNTSYSSSSICLRATQASNKVRPSLPVNLKHYTPEPHTPTSLNQTDIHAMRMSAALQRYKKSAMIVCFLFLNPNSLIQANFALRRWYDTSAMLHLSASPSRSPNWLATFV